MLLSGSVDRGPAIDDLGGRRLTTDRPVAPQEAHDALERVLASPEFASAVRLSAFLRYVVTETLAGRQGSIKGYAIAVDVFERSADFDQTNDPIVRVEASRLRRALAQYYQGSGAGDPVIVELPRGGYVPAFRRREGEVSPLPAADPADGAALQPPPAPARPAFAGRWLSAGLGLTAVAALAFAFWPRAELSAPSSIIAEPGPFDRPVIAVLPATAIGDDPIDAALAQGLTSELVSELARFREYSVLALPAGDRPQGAGYTLHATVRRAGEDLRLNATAVDLRSGETIWADGAAIHYEPATALTAQDDMARSIVLAIAQPNGVIHDHEAQRLAREGGPLIGYSCVARARDQWRRRDLAYHPEMRACLDESVALRPDYADGWQALTLLYLDEYRYDIDPPAYVHYDPLDKALEAAQRAVAVAPTDARSYQALYSAWFYRDDMDGFRKAGGEAMRLNPYNTDVLADYGSKLAVSGAWDEGLPMVRRAAAQNPSHPGWYDVAFVLDAYRRGAFGEALAITQRINAPDHLRTQVHLAMIHGELGDRAQAAAALKEVKRRDPSFAIDARATLRKWGYEKALIDACMDGLTKAGLKAPAG